MSASLMAVAALGATLLGGWVFVLVWTLAAVCVAFEWQRMAHSGALPIEGAAMLAALSAALGAASALPSSVASALVVVLAGIAAALAASPLRLVTATGVLYAAALAASVILCRGEGRDGIVVVLWLFAAVWGTDIAAYFVGRKFGGPKLWPRISPKKTWSGAIGGLLGGTLLACGLLAAAGIGVTWRHLLLSLAFSCLTQLGDLYESALKRRFGVKDSGSLIPGHGGFMDRLDGFVFAVVFAAGFGALRGGPNVPAGLLAWP